MRQCRQFGIVCYNNYYYLWVNLRNGSGYEEQSQNHFNHLADRGHIGW